VVPTKSMAVKIFENIIFLAEVFSEQADKDIPRLPVLEMAQCFELVPARSAKPNQQCNESWPLWK
jgi:hypothetical protein